MMWTEVLEGWIRQACVLEVTARKPGNVHPAASFADLTAEDFTRSAAVAAPVLARSRELGVGATILQTCLATRQAVGKNTNLGITLLIAPLAAVPQELSLAEGIGGVLENLTVADARSVYAAIAAMQPGGMGKVAEQDLSAEPTGTLREVMVLAADRDLIARQYANGFREVLEFGLSHLPDAAGWQDWETAVIRLALSLLAEYPDTLIARKCGPEVAAAASDQARAVLQAGLETPRGRELLERFDRWCRADGHRRNPGTTADFVAAILFAAFRERRLSPPVG
jgi:triphosphoribosyl-dephospho-CoA synthase